MKLERQVGFWLGGLALLMLTLYVLGGVLMPFVAGLILAYLLDPVADRLERLGLNRLGATLLILIFFTFAFALLLITLLPVLGSQLAGFIERLPGYVTTLSALAAEHGGGLFDYYANRLFEWLGIEPGKATPDIQNSFGDIMRQGAQWLGGFMRSLWFGGQALIGILSLLIVTPVVAFYLLLDWDRMVTTVDSWIPLEHREVVRQLAREMNLAMAGFLRGQSIVCLFLGFWYGVGFTLIGLNFGLLIGISAGVLSFIPYVGSLLALVLSIAVSIVQGWPSPWLLILSIMVVSTGQFLESYLLTPRLVGQSVGLHPVWLMFALIVAGSFFGFTGLLIGVPVAAAIGVLTRFALRQYLKSTLYLGVQPHRDPERGP